MSKDRCVGKRHRILLDSGTLVVTEEFDTVVVYPYEASELVPMPERARGRARQWLVRKA